MLQDIGILQGDEFKIIGVSLKKDKHLKVLNCVKDSTFEYEAQVGISPLLMGPHSKQGKWGGHLSWFRKRWTLMMLLIMQRIMAIK